MSLGNPIAVLKVVVLEGKKLHVKRVINTISISISLPFDK
jgi:hypothetical protein